MKKNEVKIGGLYVAKVSDRLVEVRIDSTNTHGGWNATNTATGKHIRVKSAQRLRGRVETKTGDRRPEDRDWTNTDGKRADTTSLRPTASSRKLSALDAAAQVLAKADKPMRAQELIAAMAEQGLWSSTNGKTPHATLYAAMLREARDKGTASRFAKVDRGLFAFNKVGA